MSELTMTTAANRPQHGARSAHRVARPLLAVPALLATLLAGCMNLAPRMQVPPSPVPERFDGAIADDTKQQRPAWDIGWDEYFPDPKLRQLIGMAIENNRDLRIATLNVERARALYRIEGGALYPPINAGAQGGRSRVYTYGPVGPIERVFGQYNATVGISAWELDFFGRIRNLKESAVQAYYATQEGMRTAQINLVAAVASAFVTLAADREQLRLADQTLKSQTTSLRLIRRTVELGAGSALDQYQVETAVQQARADAARFLGQVQKDRAALALLVGRPVPDELLPADMGASLASARALPAGIPSEVLVQRPDVLQAEHQLAAAHADIGAARAAMFPRIALTTNFGISSFALDDLFSDPHRIWAFTPSINIPIFSGGALRASTDAARIAREIAVANYEKTLQTAFREVSDTLADRATLQERIDAEKGLIKASQSTYDLSVARFRNGADSYLNALVAQRTLYGAQQSEIALRQVYAGSLITLYKVLGGGWKNGAQASLKGVDESNPPRDAESALKAARDARVATDPGIADSDARSADGAAQPGADGAASRAGKTHGDTRRSGARSDTRSGVRSGSRPGPRSGARSGAGPDRPAMRTDQP